MDQDQTPIERACVAAGSQAELARRVGVSQSIVNQWVKRRRPVPNDKCPAIEAAVAGAVTVEELQPDEKWARVPDALWPHPDGRPVLDFEKDRIPATEA